MRRLKGWGDRLAASGGWRLLLLFFLLALLPRLLVLDIALHRERPVWRYQDSLGYLMPAQSLVEGKGFQGGGFPVYWWPPGYSGFLALLFGTGIASPEDVAGVLVVQALLGSIVAGLISLLTLELGGVAAALMAGGLMAFEPSAIAYANMILSEGLFSFLLVLAVMAWLAWWNSGRTLWLSAFGILMGLLPLVRPVATYLWIPVAGMLFFARPPAKPRMRSVALFVALATLPAASWTLHNYLSLGVPVLATVGQFNEARFARAVEDLAGEPQGTSSLKQPWEMGFGADQGLSFPEIVRLREHYFWSVLLHHPVAAAQRLMLTGAGILGAPDDRLAALVLREVPDYRGGSMVERLRWLRRLGSFGGWLLLGVIVSAGGFLALPVLGFKARTWPRKSQALLGLLVLLILYQLLISSFIMFQSDRFRVPIVPLLIVGFATAFLGNGPHRKRAL